MCVCVLEAKRKEATNHISRRALQQFFSYCLHYSFIRKYQKVSHVDFSVCVWHERIIISDILHVYVSECEDEAAKKKLHLKCDLLYDGKHKVLLQKTSVLDVFFLHNSTSQEFQAGKPQPHNTEKRLFFCMNNKSKLSFCDTLRMAHRSRKGEKTFPVCCSDE